MLKAVFVYSSLTLAGLVIACGLILLPVMLDAPLLQVARVFEHFLHGSTLKVLSYGHASWLLCFASAIGVAGYVLRQCLRPLWGVVELYFGVYTATYVMAALYSPQTLPNEMQKVLQHWAEESPFQAYVALGSAIYVIVRGIDNWIGGVIDWNKKKGAV